MVTNSTVVDSDQHSRTKLDLFCMVECYLHDLHCNYVADNRCHSYCYLVGVCVGGNSGTNSFNEGQICHRGSDSPKSSSCDCQRFSNFSSDYCPSVISENSLG